LIVARSRQFQAHAQTTASRSLATALSRARSLAACRARPQSQPTAYRAWSINLPNRANLKIAQPLTASRGPLNTGRDPYGDAVSVRLQIGTLSGFVSERRPASNRRGVRLQIGIGVRLRRNSQPSPPNAAATPALAASAALIDMPPVSGALTAPTPTIPPDTNDSASPLHFHCPVTADSPLYITAPTPPPATNPAASSQPTALPLGSDFVTGLSSVYAYVFSDCGSVSFCLLGSSKKTGSSLKNCPRAPS